MGYYEGLLVKPNRAIKGTAKFCHIGYLEKKHLIYHKNRMTQDLVMGIWWSR